MRSLLGPALAAVVGVAILIGLGAWQVERLAWKEGLIKAVTERPAFRETSRFCRRRDQPEVSL